MGVRSIARNTWWIVVCSLVFLEAVLGFALPRGHTLTAVGDLTQCLLLAVAVVFLLANTKQAEQRARYFWALLGLGCALWLGAQILWTYFEVVLRQEAPNPFVGDVVLFLHLVPMMAALAVQPDRERTDSGSQLGGIDFALLLTWWLYLYLFIVIPWQYVSPDELAYGRSFDFLYLIEHLAFLACVNAAWLRSSGPWKTVYGHLMGAASVYAAASIAASFAIDFGGYYTGSLYDLPLLAAMAWFAVTALVARKLNLHAENIRVIEEKRKRWVSTLAMLAILSLPVTAGWALYVSGTSGRVRDFRVILTLIAMMVMGALTWIKQFGLDKQLGLANQELREDSLTDLLTGVRNRRFFAGTIVTDARQAIRAYSGPEGGQGGRNQDLVFYLIDADSFKEVNDRYGHDAGDELLVQIAQRISTAIRYSDVLLRWGGDEFLVLSRYTNREESSSLPARVLRAVTSEPFQLESGVKLRCTCSIGWAVFPWFVQQPEAIEYQEVLRLADSALYEAKRAGRNRAVGMLPTSVAAQSVHGDGKYGRLTEQLGAHVVSVEAAVFADDKNSTRAMTATQGM